LLSQCESCASANLINRQGLLAFQFNNEGHFAGSPVQEIHDQVDHDLHGPRQDDSHLHGEASLWPQAKVVCGPRLQELVDSFGELLSEQLQFLLQIWSGGRLHVQSINSQYLFFPRSFDEAGTPPMHLWL
jgi:hypothetical protein